MSRTVTKGRRALMVIGCFATGTLCIVCGIRWYLDQLVLPAALLWTLGFFISFPTYSCALCGHQHVHIGRRNQSCSKCKTPIAESPGTILRFFKGRSRLAAEIPIAVVLLFFGGIRLLPLPVFFLHILFGIFAPAAKRDRWLNCTAILFLAVLFMPIDIEVGGFHGPHYGFIKKGPKLVRLVKGMPMIQRCVEKYGEFISGGCVVFGNEPVWLLVWDEAGLTSWKAKSSRPAEAK